MLIFKSIICYNATGALNKNLKPLHFLFASVPLHCEINKQAWRKYFKEQRISIYFSINSWTWVLSKILLFQVQHILYNTFWDQYGLTVKYSIVKTLKSNNASAGSLP